MKKMEFDYYDWNEFKQFLDQLPDKDAAKLIATIQNIENNGLIIAERQLWVKKLENNLYEIRSKGFKYSSYLTKYKISVLNHQCIHKENAKTPESEKKIMESTQQVF